MAIRLQTQADNFNNEHPVGSFVRVKGLPGKKEISHEAHVSVQKTVLASFMGALNGINGKGKRVSKGIRVMFDIRTIYSLFLILFFNLVSNAQGLEPLKVYDTTVASINQPPLKISMPRIGAQISVGNVYSLSLTYKNFEVQGGRHLSNLSKYPFIISAINYKYKGMFAGWSSQGISFGAEYQNGAYGIRGQVFGKYAAVSITANSLSIHPKVNRRAIICGLQYVSGFAQGLREQVLHHPNELFAMHPNLNHPFWDSRLNSQGILNANHILQTIYVYSDIACIVIAIGEPRKNWKKYVVDFIYYTGWRKAGWYTSWKIYCGNKL